MGVPFTKYIPSVTALAEQAVLSYVSGSLYNNGQYTNTGGVTVDGSLMGPGINFYTGIANTDVEGPVILVTCDNAQETYFQTRVYRCTLDVSTRMIAFDSTTSSNNINSAISFGGNVASLFGDTNVAVNGINSLQTGLAAIQMQVMDYRNEKIEDAWISTTTLSLIATLVSN